MRSVMLLGVVAVVAFVWAAPASASTQHGIGFSKVCDTPTAIGDPYSCSYTIRNDSDDFGDDVTVSSLVDKVLTTPTQTSGNLLAWASIVRVSGSATCTALGGSGTTLDPWIGATSCTLFGDPGDPTAGGVIRLLNISFYTVQPLDFAANASHVLSDEATLTWQDSCTSGAPDCPLGPQTPVTSGQTVVTQLASSTSTSIHNAAHSIVTAAVAAGTIVHDLVTVNGVSGKPAPTGSVTIDWFLNGSCSGTPDRTGGPFALDSVGEADATAFAFTVTAGQRAFQAHYGGDGRYASSDGSCELLAVSAPGINVVKRANLAAVMVGGTVTYTLTVTNPGNVPLGNVSISDPKCDSGTLTGPSGDTGADSLLGVTETWTYSCTHAVVSSDGGLLHNSVSVSGKDSLGTTVTDDDSVDVAVVQPYSIVGFLSPVPNSKWKARQTVPIKIMITDANGIRISDAQAAALVSGTCRVTFSATGALTQNPTCMKYDSATHVFIYNWKLGNPTGSETITVTISYPPTLLTTAKSEQVTISK